MKCKNCDHESWLLNQYNECPNCLGCDDRGHDFIDQDNNERDHNYDDTDHTPIRNNGEAIV